MIQTLDILVRQGTIDGYPTVDGRLVISEQGAAVLLYRPNGEASVAGAMVGAEWSSEGGGRYRVTNGVTTWELNRDTRCGSCGGRYELARLDPTPFLPRVEQADPAPTA